MKNILFSMLGKQYISWSLFKCGETTKVERPNIMDFFPKNSNIQYFLFENYMGRGREALNGGPLKRLLFENNLEDLEIDEKRYILVFWELLGHYDTDIFFKKG